MILNGLMETVIVIPRHLKDLTEGEEIPELTFKDW